MADSEAAIANLALIDIGSTKNFLTTLDDDSEEAEVCKIVYPQERDRLLGEYKWPRATRHAYLSQLGGSTFVSTTPYSIGDYVSYAPSSANVANTPETVSTFVYVSLQANNTGHNPDTSPTYWAQLSRAAYAYVFQLPSDVIEVQGLYRYGRNPRYDQQVPYELGNSNAKDANGNQVGPGTLLYTDTGLPWLQDWGNSAPPSIELVYTAQVTDPKQFPAVFVEALHWAIAVKLATGLRKDPALGLAMQKEAIRSAAVANAAARREAHADPPPVPSHIAARGPRSGRWR